MFPVFWRTTSRGTLSQDLQRCNKFLWSLRPQEYSVLWSITLFFHILYFKYNLSHGMFTRTFNNCTFTRNCNNGFSDQRFLLSDMVMQCCGPHPILMELLNVMNQNFYHVFLGYGQCTGMHWLKISLNSYFCLGLYCILLLWFSWYARLLKPP